MFTIDAYTDPSGRPDYHAEVHTRADLDRALADLHIDTPAGVEGETASTDGTWPLVRYGICA